MRVLHISPSAFGSDGLFGGGERYPVELARHMSELVPTRLVTFSSQPRRDRLGKLDAFVLGPAWYVRGQRGNPIHPGLFRHIAWADVVHCHQRFILTSSLSALLCRLSGRRAFATDHGGGGWDPTLKFFSDPFDGWLHQSCYARKILGHEHRSNAEVVYGGVDVKKFSPERGVRREPLVVYVGRLLPHKGVDYLIEALPHGLTLEIIGRAYHDRYYNELKRLAEGKRVLFRHDCGDAEVIHAYRRAVCVVLPSVYRTRYGDRTAVPELLGQTLIEGMACGTPAICTNVASMPEVVDDGVTGFVIEPNNPDAIREKLEYLRDSPGAVAAMGEASRQRVLERFTWPATVCRCLKAYAASS